MRRILTSHDCDSRSRIVEVDWTRRWNNYTSVSDLSSALVLSMTAGALTSLAGTDPSPEVDSVMPAPGETHVMRMGFPPGAPMLSSEIDLAAFRAGSNGPSVVVSALVGVHDASTDGDGSRTVKGGRS